MPNVAVYDVRMNSVSQVTAFTHGRGAFSYAPGLPIIVVDGPVRPYDIACLSCPNISYLNPGDLVTIEFPLKNLLPIDTVNLTATMLSSGQISPVRGTATYGVVRGQGASVSRSFSFIAGNGPGTPGVGGACGDTVNVVFQLNDQGVDLGQVSFPFHLGIPRHPLAEDFDEIAPPGLPPGWVTSVSGTGAPWVTTSNSPPNAVPADAPDDDADIADIPNSSYPPNVSSFAPAHAGVGQAFLISTPFNVATAQAQLYFRQAYFVSNAWDGCILEISVGGQAYKDIVQAGGAFTRNGYNLALKDNNPLGPRSAWSGDSGGWLPVFANLPANASGQTVQLRWHFATSRGLTNGGWFVDAPVITEPQCLPPVSNPVIVNPTSKTNSFSFSIDTVSGRNYVLEYKTNLTDNGWQFLENLPGNGSRQTVSVPEDSANSRFFRFHLNP
jgi:hypothetical protein